jgi:cytochrome c biogenesis protein CcmG/thiol:disulfide interchange protein DsbE
MEKNWTDHRLEALRPGESWVPDIHWGLERLRDRQRATRRRSRARAWSAAAATAGLCLMAFPAPRAAAQYCLNCSVALLQNLSASQVARATVQPQHARKLAPDFRLNDASGRAVQLSSFKGQVVLLNFWATWCGGCQVEIPWFIEFQRMYADRGLAVLGVSFDDGGWKAVKPYLAAKHVNYPVMIADSRIAGQCGGVHALPVTVMIDKSGRIASTHLGLINKADYQAEIERLLRE